MVTTSINAGSASLPGAKPKGPAKVAHRKSIMSLSTIENAPAMPTGLHHSSDDLPGIRRRKRGKGFSYFNDDGQTVFSPSERERFANLAIPPAYRCVWICPSQHGHLQATGRDARGRKQYLSHPDWRTARDETKFHRMAAFGAALPRIRASVIRGLGTISRGHCQPAYGDSGAGQIAGHHHGPCGQRRIRALQ